MLLISKIQLIPANANLAMAFICKLSQSRLQVGQFEWIFPDLARVNAICGIYYACAVLGRNLAQGNTSWENPVILASLFQKVETFLYGGIAFAYAS